ncbi:hypothetical protein BH23GEM7_BH23GEM7_38330 [soil metagenome]
MWRDEGYLLEMLLAARDAETIAAQMSELIPQLGAIVPPDEE